MENEQAVIVSLDSVLLQINNAEYWNKGTPFGSLDELLQETDWSSIPPENIIPKLKLRTFIKGIYDKEVRLSVSQFLLKFANDYFFDSAATLQKEIHDEEGDDVKYENEIAKLVRKEAVEAMDSFRQELNFQIDLIKSTGEFSGDKFSRLQKQNEALEKQIRDLQEENKTLNQKIDRFEHPARYGHFIPNELQTEIFMDIMDYLTRKQLVAPLRDQTQYGMMIHCYHWYGEKGLFGYFVDKVSYELDLRDSGGRINWKLFRPAIHNFDELVKEARNTVSAYTKNPNSRLPEKADIINEAIKYSEKKKKVTIKEI